MKTLVRLHLPAYTVLDRRVIMGSMSKLDNADIEAIIELGIEMLDRRMRDCDLEPDADGEPDADSEVWHADVAGTPVCGTSPAIGGHVAVPHKATDRSRHPAPTLYRGAQGA